MHIPFVMLRIKFPSQRYESKKLKNDVEMTHLETKKKHICNQTN